MIVAADRFAQASLLDHAHHEGAFIVGLPGDQDGGDVALAFEALGCTVEPEPFELQLRVTAPRAA